ncbi:hypothetical protein OSTOST_03114, partial [Ostertagia ostertagi]
MSSGPFGDRTGADLANKELNEWLDGDGFNKTLVELLQLLLSLPVHPAYPEAYINKMLEIPQSHVNNEVLMAVIIKIRQQLVGELEENRRLRLRNEQLNEMLSNDLHGDVDRLLDRVHDILAEKAPEAIPLLEQFLGKLPLLSNEIVEADKRQRSVILYGVPEPEESLSASLRQEHTESYIRGILDTLDVETRPVEIHRMGKKVEGKPRLVKKSMTREEREKETDLRKQARERNQNECNGERIYVVY